MVGALLDEYRGGRTAQALVGLEVTLNGRRGDVQARRGCLR